VPVPANLGENIATSLEPVKRELKSARWIPPSHFHFTLRFLGEQKDEAVPVLCRLLAKTFPAHKAFPVRLAGLGVFPSPAAPDVLWIGITEGSEELRRLATDLNAALALAGFPPDNRNLEPHLTVARFPQAKPLPENLLREGVDFDAGAGRAQDIALMKSVLRPGGSIYTTLFRQSLQ